MRSLPMLWRLAEDMTRMATRSPFYEDPFYRLASWNPNWNRLIKNEETMPKIGKDGYQVSMDVSQFKPSELTVKVVDNSVVVEGKYEQREDDHGYTSGHFVRQYSLPRGFRADKAVSTLSSDGVLTVSVPKPPELEQKANERVIPIQQTGPAALNVKENPAEECKDAAKEDKNKK